MKTQAWKLRSSSIRRAVFPQPQKEFLGDVLGQRLVEQRLAGEVVDIPAPPFVNGVESLAVALFQTP